MKTYVFQVKTGLETKVALQLQRHVEGDKTACYVPRFVTTQKKNGEWIQVRKVLFPGYVFVETNDIEAFAARLHDALVSIRLLCQEDGTPLQVQDEEIDWISMLADNVTKTVDMSEGVIEGDEICITSGPLKGQEARIRKIDRHKRVAFVEMQLLGRTKTIRLGLEIVSKK